MSKKRKDRESMVHLTPKPSQSFFAYRTQTKGNLIFLLKTVLFKEKEEWRIEQKAKRRVFNCSHYGD